MTKNLKSNSQEDEAKGTTGTEEDIEVTIMIAEDTEEEETTTIVIEDLEKTDQEDASTAGKKDTLLNNALNV